MKNHLEALNESFNKINIENTSGNLFEDFTGDESESGIDKSDILDWLSDHEQLWSDCERHFHTDPNWLSADELESFICDHEQACKDYAKAFGFALEENLKESWTKMMFDFQHDGTYDEEALKAAIDQELMRQGLDWTGYIDFENMDHAYTENLKENYSSIIDHLNDAFEEILNDGHSLSDMNDIVKEELREFIRSYKAAHKHEE